MKSCTQCGHTLQDDHVFCNKCGHKWQDPEVARLAEQEKINEKLRNRKHAIIAFYVASVFTILLILPLYTPPFPVSTGDRTILKISNFFWSVTALIVPPLIIVIKPIRHRVPLFNKGTKLFTALGWVSLILIGIVGASFIRLFHSDDYHAQKEQFALNSQIQATEKVVSTTKAEIKSPTKQTSTRATTSKTDLSSANMETYANEVISYSVPSNWSETIASDDLKYYYPNTGMLMIAYDESGFSLAVADKSDRDDYRDAFLSSLVDPEVVSESEVSVADLIGYRVVATGEMEGESYKLDHIVFDHNDGTASITMVTPVSSTTDYSTEFSSVLKSIQLKGEVNSPAGQETEKLQLVYGELGQFGKSVVVDGEEYIWYYVPAGAYEVTTQNLYGIVFVNENKSYKNSSGYSETAVVSSTAVTADGGPQEIVVGMDQHIVLMINTAIEMKPLD